jgi:hypothetical protein
MVCIPMCHNPCIELPALGMRVFFADEVKRVLDFLMGTYSLGISSAVHNNCAQYIIYPSPLFDKKVDGAIPKRHRNLVCVD